MPLDDQIQQLSDAILNEVRGPIEAALRRALSDATATATADRAAAVEEAVAARIGELTDQHDQALAAARERLTIDHDAALETLREELAGERDAALAALREELEREHHSAVAAVREEAARDRDSAVEAARESAQLGHEAALAEARADRARSDEARQAAEEQVRLAHTSERESELACSERMVEAFRQLDDARTLSDVLRILTDETAAAAGRVALLLVENGCLRAWSVRGWTDVAPEAVDFPIEPGGLFGRAISTGRPVSTSDVQPGALGAAALLAAPEGRAGLVMPVSVGGQVVAIVYADDAGDRLPVVPSNWPEIAEILARHAGHRLEVLTISRASAVAGGVQRPAGTPDARPADPSPFEDDQREEESARRYARLLISELKLYNEEAVEQGRQARDLLERLGPDIERARRLYEEKIPEAVRSRVDCFDQEVVRTLAGGDPGLLGHTP